MAVIEDEETKESKCGNMCKNNLQDYALLVKPPNGSLYLWNLFFAASTAMKMEIHPNSTKELKKTGRSSVTCRQCVRIWIKLKDVAFNLFGLFHPRPFTNVKISFRLFVWRIFAISGRQLPPFDSPLDSDMNQTFSKFYGPTRNTIKDAANDGRKSGSIDKSNGGFTVGNNKVKKSMKRKRGQTGKITGLQDLEPFFSGSLVEAANKLGVSRSTLKRKCRKLGISTWPSIKGRKYSCSTSTMIEQRPRGVLPYKCPGKGESSDHKTRTKGDVQTHKGSLRRKINSGLGEEIRKDSPLYYSGLAQCEVAIPSQRKRYNAEPSGVASTIKATYKGDMIRFQFPVEHNVIQLKKEVARRLNLGGRAFKIKYWDDDDEWALLAFDSDWQECLWISRSSNTNVIRLLVQDV